jgi:DMSO/TMAO reductase YedYZ molybdopterin-dependent catalytic subunit
VDFSLGDIRRPIVCPMKPHAPLYAVNGEPLPTIHGGPLRLVIPGWPGSLSHKWLMRITIRDREHDGQGMTGTSYRVPTRRWCRVARRTRRTSAFSNPCR